MSEEMDLLDAVDKVIKDFNWEEVEAEVDEGDHLSWLLVNPETLSADIIDKTIVHLEGVKERCSGNAYYGDLMQYLDELKAFMESHSGRKGKKKGKKKN